MNNNSEIQVFKFFFFTFSFSFPLSLLLCLFGKCFKSQLLKIFTNNLSTCFVTWFRRSCLQVYYGIVVLKTSTKLSAKHPWSVPSYPLLEKDCIRGIPANIPRVFYVKTTWKRSFPRRFNMEYTWCVCRDFLWSFVFCFRKAFFQKTSAYDDSDD